MPRAIVNIIDEVVATRAYLSVGKSLTTSNASTFVWNAKDYDTSNSYNIATGEYTVPTSGWYEIRVRVLSDATTSIRGMSLRIDKNVITGTPPTSGSQIALNRYYKPTTTAAERVTGAIDATAYLAAGDKVSISGVAIDNAFTTDFSSATAYFEIKRIGKG